MSDPQNRSLFYPPADPTVAPQGGKRPIILAVDDEPPVTRSIADLFRREFEVLTANTAADGLALLARHDVAVILADQRMPGMSGDEFLTRARLHSPDAPRILITGYADVDDVIRAVNGGQIFSYVRKPWDIDDLRITVTKAAQHRQLVRERDGLLAVLRQTNAELEDRVRERTLELERSNAELERFAYVCSHDLREPLRTVSGFVELLSRRYRDQLDPKAGELIRSALDGVSYMQQLISDLLEYSRVAKERSEMGFVDMGWVASRAVASLENSIRSSGASVDIGNLPTVFGSAGQLCRLLQNLIANAITYRRDAPPEVRIACQRCDDLWSFSVADNGIGIALDDHEAIFEAFRRLHTRTDYPGTGLGLAICRRIVEAHGGLISVASVPGQGSTFSFTVPCRSVPELRSARAAHTGE